MNRQSAIDLKDDMSNVSCENYNPVKIGAVCKLPSGEYAVQFRVYDRFDESWFREVATSRASAQNWGFAV